MQELAYVGALIYDTTMPNKAEVSELRVNSNYTNHKCKTHAGISISTVHVQCFL